MWWSHVSIDQQDDQDHGPDSQQEKEEGDENELGVCLAYSGQVVPL